MNDIDISIIIPIYNGEKYIRKCLTSIIENCSNYKYEIIVINDNSTDNSLEILKEFKQIKIQNNHYNLGVSRCRNIGINISTGKYISFVDIDDFVRNHMFDKLLDLAYENDYDICCCNYVELINKNEINSKYIYDKNYNNQKDLLNFFLVDKISPAVWDKIYKKDFIKNIMFNESLSIGEDILFILDIFCRYPKVTFINEYNYVYLQQSNSAMHKNIDKLLQFLSIDMYISNENKNLLLNNYYDEYSFFIIEMKLRTIHSISSNYNRNNFKKIRNILKTNFKSDFFDKALKSKYLRKSIKFEILIMKYFGITIHLMLMPIYKKFRKILRSK